jgi:uncharacterized membrane protein (DUF2068 family)
MMSAGDIGTLVRVSRDGQTSHPADAPLVVIGVFKLAKAALLVALGVVAVVEAPEQIAHTLAHATHWTGAFSGRETVQHALAKLLSLDERTIHRLGIASLCYAAVFATEGIGLVLEKRWAEWLTVCVTGSFIPVEVYELWHSPGAGKVIALALNIAIVVYLVWRRLGARHPDR